MRFFQIKQNIIHVPKDISNLKGEIGLSAGPVRKYLAQKDRLFGI
jgi:hypothetical protein